MRFDRGIMLSVAGHGLFFAWALISFNRDLDDKPMESMPVDVISAEDFNKITAGVEKAPQLATSKPLAEKVAEAKPVEDPNAKVVEKKEVVATTDQQTPEPKPKEPEPKPAAAPPEPKKEEVKAEDKKEPEQKVDPIAEALKKEEAKKPEKKAEAKPQPVKKPQPQQPKFDPRQVAALLDKRESQRVAAAGPTLNSLASLGAPRGEAAVLSQSELSALAARLRSRWTPPATGSQTLRIRIVISLKRDGTLAAPPEVITDGSGGIYQAMRESTVRAILASQPFDMLRPANYDNWKELDLRFNTADFM